MMFNKPLSNIRSHDLNLLLKATVKQTIYSLIQCLVFPFFNINQLSTLERKQTTTNGANMKNCGESDR